MADVKEKLEQGYIQARMIIELAGKPKEHVENTLKQYVEHIKKNESFEIVSETFGDVREVEDLWATYVELDLLAKDIPSLIGFCFDYMPSSIEIIEPKEMRIKDNEFTTIMNDLQGKLHRLDMAVKKLNNENKFLQKNSYGLATNFMAVLLRMGSRKVEELSKISGMSKEDLEGFLEKLIKQGLVKKEGDSYIWNKKDDQREKQS